MTWIPIGKLPEALQRAIKRARNQDARHGDGTSDVLMSFVAREAFAAGRWHERERQARAKATPKEKALRKQLADLTTVVVQFIEQLDVLMEQPGTVDRGRAVARIRNALAFANDSARHFGLGIKLEKLGKAAPREPAALLGDVLAFVRAAAERGDADAAALWAKLNPAAGEGR